MKYPITIKDVLPAQEFIHLQDELEDWNFTNGSNHGYDYSKTFFGQLHRFDRIPYFKAATTVSLKMKKFLREDIRLIRIHSGAKVFGSYPEFHYDFTEDCKCFTFVLFTNLNWNTNWGGEFVAQDIDTGEYNYVPYIPNNGVFIPSHWQHTGTSPLTPEAGIRTSVAFMFTLENNFDQVLKKHPELFTFT